MANTKLSKVNVILSQNKNHFLWNTCIKEDVSKCNSFLFSNVFCLTNNITTLTQQFSKFVKFVTTQQENAKSELCNLFGPIICHLFIECIKGRDINSALDFLKNNSALISFCSNEKQYKLNEVGEKKKAPTHREYFQKLIYQLSQCHSYDDVDRNEGIQSFRSSKYEIEMSLSTLESLKTYMEKEGHVLIMNILNTWIHIIVPDIFDGLNSANLLSDEEEEIEFREEPQSYNHRTQNERPDNFYMDCIKQSVNKLLKVELPTRFLSVTDADSILTSGSIDKNECHLATGFNNSSIKIWQLNENQNFGRNMFTKVNQRLCQWEINNIYESEEDEFETNEKVEVLPYVPDALDGIILRGHSAGVTDVKFSKHYPLLMSTSKDNTMRVWKSNNLSCASIYKGHSYPIWCVDESPIASYVCTGSRDYTARIWCLEQNEPLITYIGHTQDVDAVCFHPNGNYIATGSSDQTVRLWCVTTGKMLRVFTDPKSPVTAICFSPNGKFIAVGGEESKLRIFDLEGGGQLTELKDHTGGTVSIAWNSSSTRLAACCGDGTMKVWDTSNMGSTNTCSKIIHHYTEYSRLVKTSFNSNGSITCIASAVNV
ncbi:hypothetical protein ACFFRR_009397 [Megaselia abdita]